VRLPASLRRRETASVLALDRPEPVSAVFGLDRGTPIDRWYIERFLDGQRARIRGRALEVGDATYLQRFGPPDLRIDVLNAVSGNAEATIIGDLQEVTTLPAAAFDCIVLVQTLQMIADPAAAVANARDALAPGGALLATLPGISQVSRYDMDRWGDFWRFTDRGAREVFERSFAAHELTIATHGNAATACAFLQGLAAEELDATVLAADHPDYPLVVTVAAVRR
jgi:SAM-dependent methyltransferase